MKVAVGFLDWLLFSVSGITGAAGVVQKVALLCLTSDLLALPGLS